MNNKIHKANIIGFATFEFKSFVGRLARQDKPKLSESMNYLNLGCGSNVVSGAINADFFSGFRFWKSQCKLEWHLDLRYPLNCRDSVFDGVFTEHTLEHIYPDDAMSLLKELYRVMKEGALIRVTVPDLDKYVQYYTGKMTEPDLSVFREKFPTGASAICNVAQNYLHLSLWDFEELKRFMEEAGFRDVQKMRYGECTDPRLCLDLKTRAWETLYVEARKISLS